MPRGIPTSGDYGDWTAQRVDALTMLHADGLSASQIAGELGGGITRNAVIGKIHRLGLAPPKRKNGAPRRSSKTHVTINEPRIVVKPRIAAPSIAPSESRSHLVCEEVSQARSSTACGILDLDNTRCRWPIGEVGEADFHFCGGATRGWPPYCRYHASVSVGRR